MDNLTKTIKEGNTCAIYTHKEDISSVLRFIKRNSYKRYRVDNKSYNSVLVKKRTTTGVFVVVNKSKIKFSDKPMCLTQHNLFIWNSQKIGGESNGKFLH